MTPKEKAKELYNKYLPISRLVIEPGGELVGREKYAKQCAIIAVEQAILYHPFPDERDMKFHEYWGNVKAEIENL